MDNEATCSLGPMSDRPLSVHVRAASLLWKKLKLSGLSNNSRYNFEDDDKAVDVPMIPFGCKVGFMPEG